MNKHFYRINIQFDVLRMLRLMAWLLLAVGALDAYADTDSGENIVIDDLSVDVRIDVKDGKATRIKEVTNYTLSARRSDELGSLSQYYDNDAITIDKASGHGGKPVYKAVDESSSIFYSGGRICVVPVYLKAGKSAKASFERTFAKPEFFYGVLPLESYDIKRFTFTLHIPKALTAKARISEHNLPDGVSGQYIDKGDETVYTVTIANLPTVIKRDAIHAPSIEMWRPYIAVNACFDNMDELYSYLRSILDDEDDTAPSVAEITASVTDGLTDDKSKIDAIAAWVRQNIRYIAIEHGEWGHRPDRAESVLEKRYGDCKGSANLIRAMLRAAGIDGRRVWIGTRNSTVMPWSESLSINSGNHMIAAAVLPDTTVYLDGTVRFAPHGHVPYMDAGQEVIIEDGNKYILTKIPVPDSDGDRLDYHGDFNIDGTTLGGTVSIDFRGIHHCRVEGYVSGVTATRRETAMSRMICSGRDGMTATGMNMTSDGPNADVTTLTASVSDINANKIISGGAKMYVSPRPLRFFTDIYPTFPTKSRTAPFDFGAADNFSAEITIRIPDGYEPENLPKRTAFDSPWFAGYVMYSDTGEGSVLCRAEAHVKGTEGSGNQLEEWNNAVREVNKASNTPLILIRKQQSTEDN